MLVHAMALQRVAFAGGIADAANLKNLAIPAGTLRLIRQ